MSVAHPAGRTRGVLLFVSLALNLFLAVFLAVQWLSPVWHAPKRGPEAFMAQIARKLSDQDAATLRAAFEADRAKLTTSFNEFQEAKRQARARLAADPLDRDALAQAMAISRAKHDVFVAAMQESILAVAPKLSAEGRRRMAADRHR